MWRVMEQFSEGFCLCVSHHSRIYAYIQQGERKIPKGNKKNNEKHRDKLKTGKGSIFLTRETKKVKKKTNKQTNKKIKKEQAMDTKHWIQ